MSAIERAQATYAVVPRELDARLDRKARGDRGCVYDLISLGGILTMFGCLIASQMGMIAFSWTYLGAAIWIGSYFYGLSRQSASGRARKAALESGPLVVGAVVRCSPFLRDAGNKRSGRAVVVFSLDEAARFDGGAMRELAEKLSQWPASQGAAPADAPGAARHLAQALLHDDFLFKMVSLGGQPLDAAKPEGEKVPPQTWLARVVVDPQSLDAPLSGRAAQIAMIVDPAREFAEHV